MIVTLKHINIVKGGSTCTCYKEDSLIGLIDKASDHACSSYCFGKVPKGCKYTFGVGDMIKKECNSSKLIK